MYSITYNGYDSDRHEAAQNPENNDHHTWKVRNKFIHPELVKMIDELWNAREKCKKREKQREERDRKRKISDLGETRRCIDEIRCY